jgi:hypothetical protein
MVPLLREPRRLDLRDRCQRQIKTPYSSRRTTVIEQETRVSNSNGFKITIKSSI